MTQLQLAIESGKTGLSRAVQRSDEETPAWKAAAISFLHWYATHHATVFPEAVWLQHAGLGHVEPAELRAYGSIVQHAQKQGWISKVPCGTQRRTLGNGVYAPVWASLIYKG